jgi:O-antigen ligase
VTAAVVESVAPAGANLNLLVLLAVAAATLALFVRFERDGEPQRAVAVVFGLLVLEMFLYYSQNVVGPGVFRPYVLGLSLRLPELVILAALAARLYVRGFSGGASPMGVAWLLFLVWWATSFVVGLLYGNGFDLALFQAKAVVYVGGGMLLAGGVPAERYVDRPVVGRWLTVLGLAFAACVMPTLAVSAHLLDLPMAPQVQLGFIGADLATLGVAVGVIALLVENARVDRRRLRVVGAGLLLTLSPFLPGQRGAILGLAVAVGLLVLLSRSAVWRRRMRTTFVEAALFLLVATVPFLVHVIVEAVDASRPPTAPAIDIPLLDDLSADFNSTGKQQSAETRQNLWRDGVDRMQQRPLVGSGLGTEYRVRKAAVAEDLVGGGFHNVVIDIGVRTGLVGLGLFGAAVAATVVAVATVWRRHPDRRVAALAMGAGIGLANLMAKGMVESVFEKYRLAAFTGLLLGVVVAAVRSLPDRSDPSASPGLERSEVPVVGAGTR